ncbi:glycoside hydrolase family 26 protein [Candidatus Burkholderia verschuerenii]|nr:glycosyl hydrolase [Candidatus Burkholderia verschuerenii]
MGNSQGNRRQALRIASGIAFAVAAQSHAFAAPAIGVHAGRDDSISQYAEFGDWVGQPVSYRVVFVDDSSWRTIANPYFLGATRQWFAANPKNVEVVSVPLAAKGSPSDVLQSVADGQQDDVYRQLAQRLKDTGAPERIIVRLGWEFNGNWFAWTAARSPDTFARAFRHVALLMRKETPGLRFEWNLARTGERNFDWNRAYPGNDVVDIVSMDVYDQYTKGWDDLRNGSSGLVAFRAFAKAHGNPEAYPEWGLSTSSHGLGDDPEFVEGMHEWFNAPDANVLYQAYWNTHADGPNAAISGPTAGRVPKAAARYKLLFGRSQ